MALLGLLALIQVGFLPGILISLSIPRLERQDRFLLALPLSCVVNYFLVVGLTFTGFYTQTVVLWIAALEAALLAAILHRRRRAPESGVRPLLDLEPVFPRDGSKLGAIRILFVVTVLAWVFQTLRQIGTVFIDGDVVQLWNVWAVQWFNGEFPSHTNHYPQLLPALYSMTYKFMDNPEVQFFAKFFAAFFPLMALAVYLRLAALMKEYAPAILLAAVFLVIIFTRTMGSGFAFNGYTDFPLAYFSLILCYVFCLLFRRAQEPGTPLRDPLLLWGAVLAGGTILLKHSGGYLAVLLPCAWYYYIGRRETNIRAVMLRLVLVFAIVFVVPAHWYIYKQAQIAVGTDSSNLAYLAQIVDLPWYAKLIRGVEMISRKISWIWVVLFGFGVTHALGRALALWIFVPFFMLWALFVSYDYRNLSLALPALSVILALGALKIHVLITTSQRMSRYVRPAAYLVLGAIAIAIAVKLTSREISEKLVEDSLRARRLIGIPEVNDRLYAHFRYRPEPGKVASTYFVIGYLPGIEDRYLKADCDGLEAAVQDPTVRYLMVSDWCPQGIRDSIAAGVTAGKYREIFSLREQAFHEISLSGRKLPPDADRKADR